MKKVLGLLTALLIVSSPASANEVGTCGQLHDDWTEYKKDTNDQTKLWYQDGSFIGYINGIRERDDLINFPRGVTSGTLCYVVGKWLENHPEKWHEFRADCVWLALKEAYGLKD